MRKLVKIWPAQWNGNGFGTSPADYELRDEVGGVLGRLWSVGRGARWHFEPNPLREGWHRQSFRTFREAREELTRDSC